MRVLLINQCFYPDHVSSSQHLSDLALALKEAGHKVSVVASSRGYDDPERRYPVREEWLGIDIHRIWTPGLGKKAKWRRFLDFGVFWLNAARILLIMPRHDVTVCLTSPPLISTLGTIITALKGGKIVPWVMDLNPDEAVAAGWLKAGGLMERVLTLLQNWSFSRAHRIIALDRYMAERIEAKGVPKEIIRSMPPWSHDEHVRYNVAAREEFRAAHGLTDKFVVMYSGNHSPCHPLDTVLEGTLRLKDDVRVQFLFVGGGSEQQKVKRFKEEHGLNNITVLPYQPMDRLSGSLSSADMHLVVMGEAFVGIVHPCKAYNILNLGIPFVSMCPRPSHLSDVVDEVADESLACQLSHGDADAFVYTVLLRVEGGPGVTSQRLREHGARFGVAVMRPALVEAISE
ncbi:MAG: glycosyltransferase family 4 protein [Verrucomicrobiaceae bacterium]|nr:glycosyltransferase family 4 protein [Verrucomicrobiaceae bacterium]